MNTSKDKSGDCCSPQPWSCCLSVNGLVHVITGVGIGYLLVEYLALGNLTWLGWGLIAVGVAGHLLGKTKCQHCC